MSPGAHLSHAARMAFDVYRGAVAVALHLEVVDVDHHLEIADFIEAAGDLAAELQHRADAYGDAGGRAAPHEQRRASA